MPDGLSGEEQAIYFSKIRGFFDSYACSRVMGRRKKMSDYIRREGAVDALEKKEHEPWYLHKDLEWMSGVVEAKDVIKALPPADVIPYSIESDGTLIITVPKGTYKNLNRVLVEEDGTHWGGLFYAD